MSAEAPAGAFRVMSYNVRYFAQTAFVPGMGSRRAGMEAIAAEIAALSPQPAVICLQEVEARSLRSASGHARGRPDEQQLEAFMEALRQALSARPGQLGYQDTYFPAHAYRLFGEVKLYTTGLAILWREDLQQIEEGALDVTERPARGPGRRLKQTRLCAHLRLGLPGGGALDVFNTHLSLPAFFNRHLFNIPGRMGQGDNQLAEAVRVADYVRAHAGDRFVLMGDFNTAPASPVYTALERRLGVKDALPGYLGVEASELAAALPSCGFARYRMRLDHLFCGPGLRVLDFEGTEAVGAGPFAGLSDHMPLLARLALAE